MWTIDRTGSKAIVTVKADHKSDIEFAIEEVMGKEGIEVRHLHLIMSRALDISDLLTIEYYCPPDELEHGEDYGVRYMKPFNSVTVSGQQGPDALPLHPKMGGRRAATVCRCGCRVSSPQLGRMDSQDGDRRLHPR